MRSINEIKKFAESKGMETMVRERDFHDLERDHWTRDWKEKEEHIYGGDILCYPRGFDWRHNNVSIKGNCDFGFRKGLTGSAYEAKSTMNILVFYNLWLIVPAKENEKAYKHVEFTLYDKVNQEKRFCIGMAKDRLFFIESDADNFQDLEEFFAGWTI